MSKSPWNPDTEWQGMVSGNRPQRLEPSNSLNLKPIPPGGIGHNMNDGYLRDGTGKIVGKWDGEWLRDDQGKLVARFDGDRTRTREGKIVGSGDQRLRALDNDDRDN